jgi:hypothetical protein
MKQMPEHCQHAWAAAVCARTAMHSLKRIKSWGNCFAHPETIRGTTVSQAPPSEACWQQLQLLFPAGRCYTCILVTYETLKSIIHASPLNLLCNTPMCKKPAARHKMQCSSLVLCCPYLTLLCCCYYCSFLPQCYRTRSHVGQDCCQQGWRARPCCCSCAAPGPHPV